MSQFILSRPIVALVLFVERWLLSSLFLFLAYEYWQTIQLMELISRSRDLLPADLIARDGGLSDGCHFADYARYWLLVASNGVSGILLLINRRPTRRPQRVREVVIPLLATFSYLGFNQRIPMPAWMTTPLVQPTWEGPLAVTGLGVSFAGAGLALAAVLWLGRSLGIVVSVRGIVLNGPYRFVRHPIYLGYLFILVGMLLTACTVRMGVLTAGAGALLIWRSRIEESFLANYSPAYRRWLQAPGLGLGALPATGTGREP